MKIYNYKFSDDFADHVGMPENKRKDTGVIAQEIQEVLPDAVQETGDVKLNNGKEVKNLLVVNKVKKLILFVNKVKKLILFVNKVKKLILFVNKVKKLILFVNKVKKLILFVNKVKKLYSL